MKSLQSTNGLGIVHLSDARSMEIEDQSVRLLIGASVFLGKGVSWDEYADLYREVYLNRGLRTLRPDGYFVVIQTDAYADGAVVPRNTLLPAMLMENGYELIDRKVWRRRKADHFQPPFSEVFVFRPSGGSGSRVKLAKDNGYFQGVWEYPQTKGGPLAGYPTELCRMLIQAFTDPGDLVLDPFAGTARLVGVAASLGRSAVGYEINEELCDVITANLGDEYADGEAPERTPVPAPPDPKEDKGADWQNGIPMATLQSTAQVFKWHDRGLVLGAFTGVKETAVATAISSGELRTAEEGGRPVAAAIVKHLQSGNAVKDFAGRAFARTAKGDLSVSRWAWYDDREGEAETLVRDLVAELGEGNRLWVELWQERPGDLALAERLGFSYVCSKIRASSEIRSIWCHGEWDPLASYSDVGTETEELSLSKLAIPPVDVAPLVDAIESRVSEWAQHYSGYNEKGSWSAVVLRGYGGDPDFIIKPSEMSKKWKGDNAEKMEWPLMDTPLRALMPEVEPILELIPGTHHRIRVMQLAADGGTLARHADITDKDAGTMDGSLLRIHIPLVTNPDVLFESWTHRGDHLSAHMGVGEVWYLDTRKPHRARNGGGSPRLHLVVDVESSTELRAMLGPNAPPHGELTVKPPDEDLGLADVRPEPVWHTGDSRDINDLTGNQKVDFIFSCPPYADLEVYSEDPADISTLDYAEFKKAYFEIVARACSQLRDDRFACFVVGDARDRHGHYYNFVGDTVEAFRAAGLQYYNEAILVTSVGSLPIRASRIFGSTRKLGKTHQNVLVFVKGDAKKATEACGDVAVHLPMG